MLRFSVATLFQSWLASLAVGLRTLASQVRAQRHSRIACHIVFRYRKILRKKKLKKKIGRHFVCSAYCLSKFCLSKFCLHTYDTQGKWWAHSTSHPQGDYVHVTAQLGLWCMEQLLQFNSPRLLPGGLRCIVKLTHHGKVKHPIFHLILLIFFPKTLNKLV